MFNSLTVYPAHCEVLSSGPFTFQLRALLYRNGNVNVGRNKKGRRDRERDIGGERVIISELKLNECEIEKPAWETGKVGRFHQS